MKEITKMWLSIAILLFVSSIGIFLKVMHVPAYGTIWLKHILGIK
jgi:hypothetical protein